MKDFWNDRYANNIFAYGKEPNVFFKESMQEHQPNGSILLPAEGEGRNAVYAAKKGLDVFAFDISESGKNKALTLAKAENVTLKYQVNSLEKLDFKEDSFDVLGLIYAHFPAKIKSDYHKKLAKLLKPNGLVIFEAFSKNNLPLRLANPKVGGPQNLEMLFSVAEIKSDFNNFEILQLKEVTINLNEGDFHNGNAKVIRFIGKKR